MIANSFPLLVHYYGVFLDEGQIHLVMEYMDCGSIEAMIAVENKLQTPEDKKLKPLIPELVISRFAWHVSKHHVLPNDLLALTSTAIHAPRKETNTQGLEARQHLD